MSSTHPFLSQTSIIKHPFHILHDQRHPIQITNSSSVISTKELHPFISSYPQLQAQAPASTGPHLAETSSKTCPGALSQITLITHHHHDHRRRHHSPIYLASPSIRKSASSSPKSSPLQ
ncbi:hypothetical protein FSOLCH5_005576 [Fusarium solani]